MLDDDGGIPLTEVIDALIAGAIVGCWIILCCGHGASIEIDSRPAPVLVEAAP